MKLGWKQIEGFVKAPDKAARAVLVYGPDDGLMRERAAAIGKTVVADLNDPFNVCVLSGDQVTEDPARLSDEASAMSMMGGARLIRVEDAGDKIAPVLRAYLENPSPENLVVIEAGELGPKSALRLLCEKAGNAAALPCYVEDERGVAQLIRQILSENGYGIQADAQAWLAAAITGDRMRARSEIDKLMLYMGEGSRTISLEDAQAACGEAGAASLDDLVYALAGSKPDVALTTFSKLSGEGVPAVMMLRAMQNHFRRLHFIQSTLADGTSLDQAMKSLQPPVFFKYEAAFKAQVQRWNAPALQNILNKLSDLEAQTKRTGTPVETLCAQAILSIGAAR